MNIEALLKEKGLNKSDFARMIGVNRQNINALLTNPTLSTLERMSNALDVPMWQLFATREEVVGEEQDNNSITCPKCGARFKLEE